MQAVVALHGQAVATQFVEAGDAPHIGADVDLFTEDLRRLAHFAQDGAGAEQLHVMGGFLLVLFEQVHAPDDACLDTCRHGGLLIRFVHHGDVVEDVLMLFDHLPRAFADDHRQLVAVGRVERAAVGNGRGHDVAVTVFVLQAFAVERGAPGGAADQEAAGAAVAGRPGQVADTLETEHRIEDVERQHRLVVAAVAGARGDEGAHGAGFVDAFLEDLTLLVLAVEHYLILVHRLIQLADRGIDAELAEHAFHAEGARLVRDDRHDALAEFLVLEQLGEDPHKGHGGGDFTIAGTVEDGLEGVQWRGRGAETVGAALRYEAAEGGTPLVQVLVFGAAGFRLEERQVLQFVVLHRDVEAVAELLEAGNVDFLGVVRGVLRLARTGAITLDGLGQDHGRLFFVVDRLMVGRIDLVRVVAATVELPDLVVGEVFDHRLEFGAVEEVLADEGAVLGLVVLVLAVDHFVHPPLQDTVGVLGQQRIPEATPDHLVDVPLGATEHAFEFLDDLAVAAHRAVEALQVAVDDEDQVVQLLAAGQGDGAEGFRLVALAVAEEAPDFLLAGRDVATVFQVFHEACLVDRLDRTQAHGHGGELPEVRHQPGVRIGRQALAIDFLAEVVELLFADPPFHEGAGVDARRGMALEEDQVAAVFLGRGLEEVVEADVIQGRGRGEAGDVAAQVRVFQVGAHHHGQGVPAHQRANAAFHEQVARHACFVGYRDGVAVRRGDRIGQLGTTAGGQFAQAGHQVMRAVFAFLVENGLKGVQPFLGFDGIEVLHGLLQGGKASRIGGQDS